MSFAVLLDVDGTLIDDNLLHVLAWSRAFRRLGHEIDASAILHAIGMGGDRLVPAILGEGVDDETAERARALHAEEYVDKGLIERSEVLPGARELLGALRARGVRTALASSARGDELARYLVMLGGESVVDAVVKKDDVPETKPAPHIFAAALDRLGKADRAVVVGDTAYDVAAARELGLPCLCVLTGGIARRVLEDAGAAAIYESVAEIAHRGLEHVERASAAPRAA
jgi:HAD superfamily hydrolase (TIGR01509 family)